MKIIYPKTKTEDVEKVVNQILECRQKVYEKTVFKDLSPSISEKTLEDIYEREKKYDKDYGDGFNFMLFCNVGGITVILTGLFTILAGFLAGNHKYLLPAIAACLVGVAVVGLDAFLRFYAKKKMEQISKGYDYYITMEDISDRDCRRELNLPYFYEEERFFMPEETYHMVKDRIREGKEIFRCADTLYDIAKDMEVSYRSLALAEDIRLFVSDCENKIDIMASRTKNGYHIDMTESDQDSESNTGRFTVKGQKFDFDVTRDEFKKIFVDKDTMDLSVFDKALEDQVAKVYEIAGKMRISMKDSSPFTLLPSRIITGSRVSRVDTIG